MSFNSEDARRARITETANTSKGARIGSSITVKGEISGSEDLLILGTVEGVVTLTENAVSIGKGARVGAHIYSNVIHVEGDVVGDLYGREQVVIFKSGSVRGNVSVPRLSLEDGARIKGVIDTELADAQDAPLAARIERTQATTTTQSAPYGAESVAARRNGSPISTRATTL